MGLQALAVRNLHRIEDVTRLRVLVARVNNGEDWARWFFITDDHRHGWFDRLSLEWGIRQEPVHASSCALLFGPEAVPRDETHGLVCHRGDWHLR